MENLLYTDSGSWPFRGRRTIEKGYFLLRRFYWLDGISLAREGKAHFRPEIRLELRTGSVGIRSSKSWPNNGFNRLTIRVTKLVVPRFIDHFSSVAAVRFVTRFTVKLEASICSCHSSLTLRLNFFASSDNHRFQKNCTDSSIVAIAVRFSSNRKHDVSFGR